MKQLKRHMKDTVTVATPTGEDDWGKPTWSSTRTIKARTESETVAVKTEDGIEFVQKDTLHTFDEVKKQDLIWLSGADSTDVEQADRAKSVESTKSWTDDITYYVVTLG